MGSQLVGLWGTDIYVCVFVCLLASGYKLQCEDNDHLLAIFSVCLHSGPRDSNQVNQSNGDVNTSLQP